ncbi:TetR/AcrR family transcriptional regulator [Nocardioides campestrisoli]|uniref:TetR/AcrR family transcriptional regulator n=1 Tax=Nocardioides campestrisoli TaxID=2736757 RepID=UPI00163D535C|nr:TetR/AcrR family transcriptional regulator [Nocardioides campestrisoli]
MSSEVKARRYDASRRRVAAQETRRRVLAAARDLFTTQGYDATSVAAIAEASEVSVDTVYASVGRKPRILLAVHDMELADADEPVGSEERDYVKEIRVAGMAAAKIELYAAALAARLPRTVPLMGALRAAGARDQACRAAYEELSQRRAANMRLFAEDLVATGELRADVTVDEIATLVWSMNSPDYFTLLAEAGRTPREYADLLVRVWSRTFLAAPG